LAIRSKDLVCLLFSFLYWIFKWEELNKRHNLNELFFDIKVLQNLCIAVAMKLFLSAFISEKSRSKMSII
ncbi:MAG: hypothetical protein AAF847_07685, partial [Bacteroidota bacterium]